MTADRSAAADTPRDELAEALWRHWADADNEPDADWSIVPDDEKHTWRGYADVALRYADAQVAAERERIARAQAVGHIHENCPCRRDFVNIARGQP